MEKLAEAAIFDILKELADNTRNLENEKDFKGKPLESDEHLSALYQYVLSAANYLFLNDVQNLKKVLEFATDFAEQTGRRFGHIWGDGTMTGTWGVRYARLLELKFLVDFKLPEELLPENLGEHKYFMPIDTAGDFAVITIDDVRFTKYSIVLSLRPQSYTTKENLCHWHPWGAVYGYSSLLYGGKIDFIESYSQKSYKNSLF